MALVENLGAATASKINLMSDSTKVAAADKLAKFNPKIGYPEQGEDYSKLSIKADDLIGNAIRASEVEHAKSLAKLGALIDKDEWHDPTNG